MHQHVAEPHHATAECGPRDTSCSSSSSSAANITSDTDMASPSEKGANKPVKTFGHQNLSGVDAGPAKEPRLSGDASTAGKLLMSGAMAAVVSRTAVAPLERVKMELVVSIGDL
jgi:hypothetical protein